MKKFFEYQIIILMILLCVSVTKASSDRCVVKSISGASVNVECESINNFIVGDSVKVINASTNSISLRKQYKDKQSKEYSCTNIRSDDNIYFTIQCDGLEKIGNKINKVIVKKYIPLDCLCHEGPTFYFECNVISKNNDNIEIYCENNERYLKGKGNFELKY